MTAAPTSRQDILRAIQGAGIPPAANGSTLMTLGQSAMRAVIVDRIYKSQGVLQSISFSPAQGMDTPSFHRIACRFAIEMLLSGEQVWYTNATLLDCDLRRYSAGAEDVSLGRNGSGGISSALGAHGYLAVWGLDVLPSTSPAFAFLSQHIAKGGGVIAAVIPRANDAPLDATSELDSVLGAGLQVRLANVTRTTQED